MTATKQRADNVFLTPRVIDQAAFDELASALRELISHAEDAGRGLGEHVEQAGAAQREQARSAEQLQERLRLSARMLKAFQSQIVRTEAAIAELDARQANVQALEDKVEQAVRDAGERIDSLVNAAMERFQQKVDKALDGALERLDREVEARVERIQRLGADVDALMPAAERLNNAAEQAEVTVTALAYRTATVAVELDERAADIHTLFERADAISRELADELSETHEQVSSTVDRGRDVADQLRMLCAESESTREALSDRINAASAASRTLAIDLQACEALETLLEQLKPWEPLAFSRPGDGHPSGACEVDLPEPAARLVDELRNRLDRDLEAFSSVLEHVAEQFRKFSCRDHARREVRELDARDERDGASADPAHDSGDEGVVSVIQPASPLSFSSHTRISRAE